MRTPVTVPSENEIKRQNDFMLEIKALNDKKNTAPKFFINTFGCQMNAHDSEKINGMLREMGYVPAEDEKSAVVVGMGGGFTSSVSPPGSG